MVKTNINKKDIAKDLYLKGGCTQEEIALKVGTTRQTFHHVYRKHSFWHDTSSCRNSESSKRTS